VRNYMNSVHVAREEKRWQQYKKIWGSGSGRQRKRKAALWEFLPQLREDFLQTIGREIGGDRRDSIAADQCRIKSPFRQ